MVAARRFLPVLGLCALAFSVAAREPEGEAKPALTYQEVMVPMRDGVALQTVILKPAGATGPLPILLRRTPYGVPDKAPDKIPDNLKALAADGYIFVVQNLRGRFKSEGKFVLDEDVLVDPATGTIETRDAYDTIDWLVKNVEGNDGGVGMMGVSYDGYTTAAALLGPHPALKAVSEQAAPTDQWMNDDDHRYGALRLSYSFEYAVMEEADKEKNTHFAFDVWDTYQWYLDAGPLGTLNDKYLHGAIAKWNQMAAHPDYDDFWQKRDIIRYFHRSTVPNLNVAGFWDQEDPWGPWRIFRHAAESDPDHTNLMVAGPWRHGGWHGKADMLGPIPLGEDTAQSFREKIEAPFFAYWLHGKGEKPAWTATLFQTGSNVWKSYPVWPPREAVPTSLYLHANGRLDFVPPGTDEKDGHVDYASDPAKPVPYRQRPISPTYPGGDWRTWEMADQRFVDGRPDVLTFVSAPLDRDLTVTGEVAAKLYAATSGTDGDFILKLIDVFPEDEQKPDWSEEDGPKPGAYAQVPNGYELPIAMEVRRGRYLKSFEKAQPLPADKPLLWEFPLRDRDHVFRKGHRIMVQIQSSWFPLIDRNPQKFVSSIFQAKAPDFTLARQRVFASPQFPSQIILPVIP